MEKFVAIFAIDGHTTNVKFDIAEQDIVDIRIEYNASDKTRPIKVMARRQKEEQGPPVMAAESASCTAYNNVSEILQANQLVDIQCQKKDL